MTNKKESLTMRMATDPKFTIPISIIAVGLNLWNAIDKGSVDRLLFSFGAIFVFTILNIKVYREYKKGKK